ncbi:hypothetical protein Dda_3245 [Drechslerella dactyloides]|uniref:Uncharacterized protein n=1 Tax=Drechslerella dactyloides TaxID=74499 RepID=A0AAD6J5H8_DREDA|nr:hypothetical protein Dda_3245 [Drechslerella dactyloides]
MKAPKYPLIRPILATVLSLAVTAIIAVLPFQTWQLTEFGVYNSYQHTVYATVSTIISTLCTLFITTQIRFLWIEHVDVLLTANLDNAKTLDRTWRTALGISSISDMLHNLHVQLTFLLAGLITTALVASFTPTTFQVTKSTKLDIPDGNPYNCASENATLSYYTWNSSTTSTGTFGCGVNLNGCPTRFALTLLGNINTNVVTEYAYDDSGVAISGSAAGAPLGIYSSAQYEIGQAFGRLTGTFGSGLMDLTACVPVMVSTPFQCRVGGTITTFRDSKTGLPGATATSDNGLCVSTQLFQDTQSGSWQSSGFCAHGQIGQGTIVLGSTGGLTHFLGAGLGLEVPHSINDTFVVTCDVDARQSFAYRSVTLSLQNYFSIGTAQLKLYGRSLSGSVGACTPEYRTISDTLFAMTAGANWQVLDQNRGNDGLLQGLADKVSIFAPWRTDEAAETPRQPPWVFPNSRNALEDVLGLTSAIVVSRINSTTVQTTATYHLIATRIGSGHAYSLAYCIPPLAAAIILTTMLIRNRREPAPSYHTSTILSLLPGRSRYSYA